MQEKRATSNQTDEGPKPLAQNYNVVFQNVDGAARGLDGQDAFDMSDPSEHRGNGPYKGAIGGNDRRFLMLFYGMEGLNWFPAGCIARASRLSQSFMYPAHIIDGDDLLVVARSSIAGQNRHDADTCTFHRIKDFRNLAMDLVPEH